MKLYQLYKKLITITDKKEFVNRALDLINNPELRYKMGQYGRNRSSWIRS